MHEGGEGGVCGASGGDDVCGDAAVVGDAGGVIHDG